MTALEAYKDALSYAKDLKVKAEKFYQGTWLKGIQSGLNMMIKGLEDKIREIEGDVSER